MQIWGPCHVLSAVDCSDSWQHIVSELAFVALLNLFILYFSIKTLTELELCDPPHLRLLAARSPRRIHIFFLRAFSSVRGPIFADDVRLQVSLI